MCQMWGVFVCFFYKEGRRINRESQGKEKADSDTDTKTNSFKIEIGKEAVQVKNIDNMSEDR